MGLAMKNSRKSTFWVVALSLLTLAGVMFQPNPASQMAPAQGTIDAPNSIDPWAGAELVNPRDAGMLLSAAKPHVLRNETITATASRFDGVYSKPMVSVLPELERAANAGDVQAGCVLAEALNHCNAIKQLPSKRRLNVLQHQLTALDARDSESADIFARELTQIDSAREFCGGVPDDKLEKAGTLLVASARQGQRSAMFHFIDGSFLNFDDLSFLSKAEFKAWQNSAESFALEMLAKGWPEIVPALSQAYKNDASPFSAVVKNDPKKARVFELLESSLFAEPVSPGSLSNQEEADARRSARLMHAQLFKSRIATPAEFYGPPTLSGWHPEYSCR